MLPIVTVKQSLSQPPRSLLSVLLFALYSVAVEVWFPDGIKLKSLEFFSFF